MNCVTVRVIMDSLCYSCHTLSPHKQQLSLQLNKNSHLFASLNDFNMLIGHYVGFYKTLSNTSCTLAIFILPCHSFIIYIHKGEQLYVSESGLFCLIWWSPDLSIFSKWHNWIFLCGWIKFHCRHACACVHVCTHTGICTHMYAHVIFFILSSLIDT